MAKETMPLQERAVRTTLEKYFEPHIDLSDVIDRHNGSSELSVGGGI